MQVNTKYGHLCSMMFEQPIWPLLVEKNEIFSKISSVKRTSK